MSLDMSLFDKPVARATIVVLQKNFSRNGLILDV